MANENNTVFNTSLLSDNYKDKHSLDRYNELRRAFPNTLIVFVHEGCCYGFNETAVAFLLLLGFRFFKKRKMLVNKVTYDTFTTMVNKGHLRGHRYIIDDNGILKYSGGEEFVLSNALSWYEKNQEQIIKSKSSPLTKDPYSKHGHGWQNDAYVPGLPSSRYYRKKPGKK